MTTTYSYDIAAASYLNSGDDTYATAAAGTGTVTVNPTADGKWYIGEDNQGPSPVHNCTEAFDGFTYVYDSTVHVVTADLSYLVNAQFATSVPRNFELREYDWSGGGVTSADWRTPSQLAALTLLGTVTDMAAPLAGQRMRAGSPALLTRLQSTGTVYVVGASSLLRTSVAASTGFEYTVVNGRTGAVTDPLLEYSTVPKSTLFGVLHAQADLSDSTHVVLESDGADTPTLTLRRHNGVTATTIATLPIGATSTDFAAPRGSQNFALAVDSADNIYIVGPRGSAANDIAVKAYVKGGGLSWTPATTVGASCAAYDAPINQVAATWHSTGGTAGTLVVWVAHSAGTGHADDQSYLLVSADTALAGTGTVLRGSGSTTLPGNANADDAVQYSCPQGTCLDLETLTATRGIVASTRRDTDLGTNDSTVIGRYILAADGASITSLATYLSTYWYASKDASARTRVIPINSTTHATVAVTNFSGFGLTVEVRQNTGTSSTFTRLGTVRLDDEGIASMPAFGTLAVSQAWDAIYDATTNKIWVYYLDVANGRTIRRTSVNLATYLATADEVTVATGVGASGSTNLALRCSRSLVDPADILITVANRASGGGLSTIYVADGFNQPPTAPTLDPKTNFDSGNEAEFGWTFNDPNPSDTQSAFQLQINTHLGVSAYDTGKVGARTSYVAAGTPAADVDAGLEPVLPAGYRTGDLLLLLAAIRNSGTGTPEAPDGWAVLADASNMALYGRFATGSEVDPFITYAGSVSGADTYAQVFAVRGAYPDLATVAAASATQLNSAAQNIAYPALSIPASGYTVLVAGWKQDDWTSVATLAGFTEATDYPASAGSDQGIVVDYVVQTAPVAVTSGSFAVTGGASAISRALVVGIKPAPGSTTEFVLGASALSSPGSWQWRVRTYDTSDQVSPWSDFGTFSTGEGGNVTVTAPASDNPAGVITDSYLVQWTLTGASQEEYRVVVASTADDSVLVDTGYVTSVDTSYLVTGLVSDVEYEITVTTRTSGVVSGAGTRLLTASYGRPEQPTVAVTPGTGYVLVQVGNPAPSGDRPVPLYNLIMRRVSGTGDYVAVGVCDPDGEFRDYAAGAGVTYQYVARAVA